MSFKEGDFVVVTANYVYHGFNLGEVITLKEHDEDDIWIAKNQNHVWLISEKEFKSNFQPGIDCVF